MARQWGLSPLRNAVPPGAMPASSSPLVAMIFSRLLKVSRCCSPTDVMMPYWGRTSLHSALMSPGERAPISATNTWCSGVSCSRITRVTPMVVLKLAGVMSAWYF